MVTVLTATAAITLGATVVAKWMHTSGPDPVAQILARLPTGHSAALVEKARQHLIVEDVAAHTLTVVSKPKVATEPASGGYTGTVVQVNMPAPNPGTAQSIAYNLMSSYGFSPKAQFGCLYDLWERESGWRYNAENASGAYGIPQALPGSKMASAGPDWQTNPTTQIKWGLGYIQSTYGTPCSAWVFWEGHGWY